jgi:hypothetical protein
VAQASLATLTRLTTKKMVCDAPSPRPFHDGRRSEAVQTAKATPVVVVLSDAVVVLGGGCVEGGTDLVRGDPEQADRDRANASEYAPTVDRRRLTM